MNKLLILLALLAANAQAENWVEVGVTGEGGQTVFADTDSVTRTGDEGAIKIRVGDDPEKSRAMVQTYNCPARLATNGSLLIPVDQVSSITSVKKTFDLACKKWYEFWK